MKQALSDFKQYLEQRYPGRATTKHYMSDLSIIHKFVGEISPKAVTPQLIDKIIQSQHQQGLKATTINRRLTSLSAFFQYLIERDENEEWRNPVRWKRQAGKTGRHLPRDVSDETVRRLFAVIDDSRDRAIFTLMLGAGLRVGEVVALKLQDVTELESSMLTQLHVCGKGDKERIALLTSEAMRPLKIWLTERPSGEYEQVFLNQFQRPLTVSGVQYRLKQYCQKAEVEVSCHQLRHTFARRLAEQQMPLDSLAKLLGHARLQTTQLYIDGADPTVRQDFLSALEGSLTPVDETIPEQLASTTSTPTPQPRLDPQQILDKMSHLTADLPTWLAEPLQAHMRRCIAGWQPHLAHLNAHNQLATLCRLSRWLVKHRNWQALDTLKRADLTAYVQARQADGIKPQSIKVTLNRFRRFWRELLELEIVTNSAVMLVKAPLVTSQPLPKYLTLTQFQRLEQIVQQQTQANRPQDRLNQTWFYLLAYTGIRRSELLNLRVTDCDLEGQRLAIRAGKGNRDRIIPLTPRLVRLLALYLQERETADTDHLLIHKGRPVGRFLIAHRLKTYGELAHINGLSPHRLRHTLATLLVNQGMPITSLQKLLGHQDINKTLIYARVHDETVRQQFVAAMNNIEALPVPDWPQDVQHPEPITIEPVAV